MPRMVEENQVAELTARANEYLHDTSLSPKEYEALKHRGCVERSWSEPTGFTADALVRNHSSAIRIAGIRILPPVASAPKSSTRTPSGTVTSRCRRSPAPVTLPSESRLLAFVRMTTLLRSGPRPTGAGPDRIGVVLTNASNLLSNGSVAGAGERLHLGVTVPLGVCVEDFGADATSGRIRIPAVRIADEWFRTRASTVKPVGSDYDRSAQPPCAPSLKRGCGPARPRRRHGTRLPA